MPGSLESLFASPSGPPPVLTITDIKVLLQRQAATLIAVSTGGPTIKTVNDDYISNAAILTANLSRLGIANPFPWADLWEWYGHYSSTTDHYWERRQYVRDAVEPAVKRLNEMASVGAVHDTGPVGEPRWEDLEGRLSGLLAEMTQARDLDGWQDVGRRCREILIDLGKLIADLALVPPGQPEPKAGDAKNWLALYLASLMTGSAHAELRALIPKAWDLAQKVTHGAINDVDAYAAAQATVLIVRTIERIHAHETAVPPRAAEPDADVATQRDPWDDVPDSWDETPF